MITNKFKNTYSLRVLLISISLLFSLGYSPLNAQEKQEKPKNKINVVWLPVIASTPANGWMFGVAPAANWLMGDKESTSISSTLASLIYTTKKQFLFTFKSTVFGHDDSFVIMQDWRYFITSQPTFGLGTGPQSAKLVASGVEYQDGLFSKGTEDPQYMNFNFLRLHQTFLKRSGASRFFYGIGYHLDIHSKIDDKLLDLESVPPLLTSHYSYSQKYGFNNEHYSLSGFSLNLLLDTRDNTINPYNGRYAFATFRFNPTWIGSTKSSSTLWVEYRDYIHLSSERKRNLLAFWFYGNFQTSGALPYLDLPALGWDQFGRSGRAYPQGRFRGENLLYSELEWRLPLSKKSDKLGAVIFLNATTASNTDADIKLFSYVNLGYGLGLRYMVNEEARTNLCLDFGFGDYGAKGFYLGVNEVF